MKKIFGIIFLVLALLSAINVISKLSHSGARATGSRAYDTGHKFGMLTAPVILGAIGLWLLLSTRERVISQSPQTTTKPPISGKVLLWIGIAFALMVGLLVAGQIFRKFGNQTRLRASSPAINQTRPPVAQLESSQPAAYSVGDAVEAHWTGKWVPGEITEVLPGGFNFMVQLEDARFPHPIVLSTNLLRAKRR